MTEYSFPKSVHCNDVCHVLLRSLLQQKRTKRRKSHDKPASQNDTDLIMANFISSSSPSLGVVKKKKLQEKLDDQDKKLENSEEKLWVDPKFVKFKDVNRVRDILKMDGLKNAYLEEDSDEVSLSGLLELLGLLKRKISKVIRAIIHILCGSSSANITFNVCLASINVCMYL